MQIGLNLALTLEHGGAGAPTLDMTFTGTGNALDSRITFTRASTAMYFDSAGVLTSAANNVPRFDYNPSTLAARGFLIEEARTNSIRNNTMQGAVAGTPGTLPTNWNAVGVGLAFNVVGLGTEAGLPYIDIQVVGTTGGTSAGIRFDTNAGISAVAGQVWTASAYARMVAGSTTNISAVSTNCAFLDAGAGIVNGTSVSFISTISQPSLPLARRTAENVVAGVGTLYVRSQIIIAYASGVAIDITLRIGLPQLELGAFATSVILTTNALALGVTRSADAASVNTLSPWYSATEGTLFAEATARLGITQGFAVLEGAAGAGMRLRKNSANQYSGVLREPTNRDVNLTPSPALIEGQTIKEALAIKQNDCALSGGGQAPATQSTFTIPTVTAFSIGGSVGAGEPFANSWIRRITYYPRRLSNAELQSITA